MNETMEVFREINRLYYKRTFISIHVRNEPATNDFILFDNPFRGSSSNVSRKFLQSKVFHTARGRDIPVEYIPLRNYTKVSEAFLFQLICEPTRTATFRCIGVFDFEMDLVSFVN